jgi:APA family basic amino acid/polyamine antiporter
VDLLRARRRGDIHHAEEDAGSAYRVPGYPVVPLLFVGVATWFVINTLIHQSADSLVGLLLLLAGLPFYYYWKRTLLRAS